MSRVNLYYSVLASVKLGWKRFWSDGFQTSFQNALLVWITMEAQRSGTTIYLTKVIICMFEISQLLKCIQCCFMTPTYRGTIDIKIILAESSDTEGADIVGTFLALCWGPRNAHELGRLEALLWHALICSLGRKIWSTRMLNTCLSPCPACFCTALWPAWYGESGACEHALMYWKDSRGLDQIQGGCWSNIFTEFTVICSTSFLLFVCCVKDVLLTKHVLVRKLQFDAAATSEVRE